MYTEELPGESAIMLFIKNIREADQGAYVCKGVYANNDQMEARVQLQTFSKIFTFLFSL